MSQKLPVSPDERVREIFGAFDGQDLAGFTALMTDDVRLRLGNAAAVEGKPAFMEAVNAFLGSVATFRHEIVDVWSDRDALVAELEDHYTRLDGEEVTLPCCNVFRLRDGLVADYRSYIDISPVYA
jgi:ketosteroid isomerase-like protein